MKQVFISFSVPEDSKYRDFLIAQTRNSNSPFEFTYMANGLGVS